MAAPLKNGHGNINGSMIPLASAATVIMLLFQTISYLAWNVTNANIDRIEKRVQAVEMQFLRIREHEEYVRRLDAQITKMEARLADIATRGEVDSRLGINSNSIIQVRTELDALKRELGQTYSVKDALASLQTRLDRMETWSRATMPQPKP